MSHPPVLFFAEAGPEQPCSFYRCFLPARALQLRGWRAAVTGDGIIWPDGRFGSTALARPTDLAVIRRPVDDDGLSTKDISEQVRAARAAGQTVYVDVDDDLWNLPPTNPASELLKEASLEAFANVINASDGVLCSTPGLAASIGRWAVVPTYVCPNGIDPSLYPARQRLEHDPLRIGWLGPMKWRHDDLTSIADWLVPFLNARAADIEFFHLGRMPDDKLQAEDLLPGLKLPIQKIPWVPFQCLGDSLAEVDVMVVPQRRGGVYEAFANARSPTSAVAAIAAGAVIWATPIDSYLRLFGEALPPLLASIVDDPMERRMYRRRQRRMLESVNLAATAAAYEKVFAP